MKTVRTSILIGFAIVLFIGLIISGVGIVSITMIQRMSTSEAELQNTRLEISSVLNAHYNWRQMLTETALNGTEFRGSLDPTTCAFGNFFNSETFRSITDAESLHLLEQLNEPHNYIHIEARRIQEFVSAGNLNAAREVLNSDLLPTTNEVISLLNNLETRYTALIYDIVDNLLEFERNAIIVIIIISIIAIGAGIVISIFLAGKIENSLRSIIDRLMLLSKGINASASQLNEASSNLAQGSSEQAASIEETSAAMNETSSMVQQNAENTRLAAQLASDSMEIVEQAGQYMMKMMETMSELKESSNSVGKIIRTIEDIAFQTNLLAINATVEAARTGGEAGRSFGVVAAEVRTLAQRSAESTSSTASIIDKNINLTNVVREEADSVLKLAGENAKQIEELNKLISDINAASAEQADGIKQINIAVSQMEKVTQENAAVAEETSAASQSMRTEIINLEEAVQIAEGLITNKT